MRLFADLVDQDGMVRAELWESRSTTRTPVGRCHCGHMLTGRAAEQPPYSTVTYRDVTCPAGHESTIVGRYQGRTLGVPPATVDTSEARHPKEEPQ